MTILVFLLLTILILDYYYAGLIRVLILGYSMDKPFQSKPQFDQRVASVSSNLKVKKILGLRNPFYSGQHCRVVIDDSQMYVGKARYSSQLIVKLEWIENAKFSIKSIGYSSVKLKLKKENEEFEVTLRFFKSQEGALRSIFESS